MKCITWETADLMMKTAAYIYCQCFVEDNEEPAVEEVEEFARAAFIELCEIEGIEEVEEAPEDEEEDEEEEPELLTKDIADLFNSLILSRRPY